MDSSISKLNLKPYPLGWKAQIGLLMPSHDTGYGLYEFQVLCPDGVVILMTRVKGGKLTADYLKRMSQDAVYGAQLLADAGPDVICYGPTAACFVLGVRGEEDLQLEIQAKTGIKTTSGASNVVEALKSLGIKKMSMLVPTNQEITKLSVRYFEDQGLEVKDCEAMGEESLHNIDRMPPWETYTILRKLYKRNPEVDGIFVTGGCWRTLEILDTLEKNIGLPVVSTTTANMWRCLQIAEVHEPINDFGQLLAKTR